jgi:hypothetical protein
MRYTISQLKKMDSSSLFSVLPKQLQKVNDEESFLLHIQNQVKNNLFTYNGFTKTSLNDIVIDLRHRYNDYRSYMLQKSKKVDLPNTILNVVQRTLNSIEEEKKSLDELVLKANVQVNHLNQMSEFSKVADEIRDQEEEYVELHGQDSWDCLIGCVESGDIKREDLPSYGIENKKKKLNNIKP